MGDDTFIVEGTNQGTDSVSGGDGFDTIMGGDGDDDIGLYSLSQADSIELIDGGLGSNTIVGNGDGNILDFSSTELRNIASIDGGGGFDTIIGSFGNDVIIGGTAGDTLNGGAGDDIIIGDTGNDFLEGGSGSDTYRFSLQDGQDKINNHDAGQEDSDTLSFDGITYDDLWFSQQGNNLVIDVVGTNDRVTVNNWFKGDDYHLDTIEAGSHVLQDGHVSQLVNAMAVFDVPAGVGEVIPQDTKYQLEPVLASVWQ